MKKIKIKYLICSFCLMLGILGYFLNVNSTKGYCDSGTITPSYNSETKVLTLTGTKVGDDVPEFASSILSSYSDATEIIFTGDIKMPVNCSRLFDSVKSTIKKITFESKIDTSITTSMEEMFYNCNVLENITGLEYFNTSNVKYMNSMFSGCTKLEAANISTWNTSNVETMSAMFYECDSLTSIDISNFNTTSCAHLGNMFYGCDNLQTLYLNNFKVSSSLTNAYQIAGFTNGCKTLNNIYFVSDMESWPASQTTSLFAPYASNVETNIYLPAGTVVGSTLYNLAYSTYNWSSDGRNVTEASVKYYDSERIDITLNDNKLTITGTKSVTGKIPTLDAATLTTLKDTISANKTTLTEVEFKGNIECGSISFENLFSGCTALETVTFGENFDTSNVTNMGSMFDGCSNLSTINGLQYLNTNAVTAMYKMFCNCSNLTNINISNFNTSNVTNMANMFKGCTKLESLNLSGLDISNTTSKDLMLKLTPCINLTHIDLPSNICTTYNIDLPVNFSAWYYEDRTEDSDKVGTKLPKSDTNKTYITSKSLVETIADQTYTGSAIEPEVTVTGLTKDTHYTVSYSNNTEVGTATITITGIGTYDEQIKTITFNIVNASSSSSRKRKKKTVTEETTKEDDENKDEEETKDEEKTEEEIIEEEKKFDEERYEKVKKVSHVDKAYVNGYEDSTFKPTKTIERAEVAAMLSRLSLQFDTNLNYSDYNDTFTDLDDNEWYDNYVGYSVKAGYLKGYLDGTFRPEENMTRAEFTVAVKRMYDVILDSNNIDKANFSDIEDEWYEEEVKIMASNEYVEGYDNIFDGDRDITRAEACTIINKVIKRLEALKDQNVINNYSDVFTNDWYYEDVTGASVDIDTGKITK